jgi:hypothetical protein
MQRAHETGDFLVVDNDLTRCLGIGDITVVPTKFAWRHPLSIELKSSAVPGIAAVDVDMLTTVSSDPMHTQLHEAFVHALNLNEGALRQLDIRGVKQKDEMLRRGELLARVFNVPRNVVSTHQSTWKSLRNVLDRTLQFGSALDVPEPGVAYIAICCWDNDAGVKDLAQLTELLRDVGIPKGEPSLTVEDFRTMESLSSVVAPIYLWSLPSHQRIALLIGDVFLGVVFAESVWRDAFAKEGMVLHENNSEWQISGNHVDFSFDRFEVLKLKAGVAFGGISPRAVAREIADMETRQHAD